MSTINIKTQQIEKAISDLRIIQSTLSAAKKTPPPIVGGGKTVNQLEEIGKLYWGMNQHLSSMLESTVCMLKRTKEEFETNDQSIAAQLRK